MKQKYEELDNITIPIDLQREHFVQNALHQDILSKILRVYNTDFIFNPVTTYDYENTSYKFNRSIYKYHRKQERDGIRFFVASHELLGKGVNSKVYEAEMYLSFHYRFIIGLMDNELMENTIYIDNNLNELVYSVKATDGSLCQGSFNTQLSLKSPLTLQQLQKVEHQIVDVLMKNHPHILSLNASELHIKSSEQKARVIKLFNTSAKSHYRKTVLNEFLISQKVEHLHVKPPVFLKACGYNRAFMVMNKMQGKSLYEILDSLGKTIDYSFQIKTPETPIQNGIIYLTFDTSNNFQYSLIAPMGLFGSSEINGTISIHEITASQDNELKLPWNLEKILQYKDAILTIIQQKGHIDKLIKLHVKERLQLCCEIASASDNQIFKIGIRHRDLKPHHIFINSTPLQELSIKIIDYGFGYFLDAPDHQFVGSPLYMAPEILFSIEGQHVKYYPTTEIYTLGLIFREILGDLGNVSYRDISLNNYKLLRKKEMILDLFPDYLAYQISKELKVQTNEIVAKMLNNDPSQRPDIKTVLQIFQKILMCYKDELNIKNKAFKKNERLEFETSSSKQANLKDSRHTFFSSPISSTSDQQELRPDISVLST